MNKERKQRVLGEKVRWKITGRGHKGGTIKRGVVVEVVAAGESPTRRNFPDLFKNKRAYVFDRDHESYIVRTIDARRNTVHYWPHVIKLENDSNLGDLTSSEAILGFVKVLKDKDLEKEARHFIKSHGLPAPRVGYEDLIMA